MFEVMSSKLTSAPSALPNRSRLGRENWDALDGLRGISIIFVVLVHFWAHSTWEGTGIPVKLSLGDISLDITWIFATGSNGVSTFFVLSGFLLYSHWIESDSNISRRRLLGDFYRRRLRRILPAFAYFTAIYMALVLLVGKHHFGAELTPANVLLNLSFLSPIPAWFGSKAASSLDIVPGTWSLNPEMWFYLIMPILAWLFRRLPTQWIAILTLSMIAPGYRASIGPDSSFIIRFALPGVADAFLFGMAVAAIRASGWIRRAAGLLFPIGAAWYFACCASVSPLKLDWASQVPAASALMIAGLIAPGNWPWKKWLAWSPLVFVGKISYSMFLSNVLVAWYIIFPLCQLAGLNSSGSRFLANLFIGFPILYIISRASYTYVELPYMSRRQEDLFLTIQRACAVFAVVAGLSLFPSALVDSSRDEGKVGYDGVGLRLIRRISALGAAPMDLQPVSIFGNAVVDSESGHNALLVEQTRPDEIRISYSGSDNHNRWLAIMLPANIDSIVRGRTVYMAARLATKHASDAEGCLGIYSGSHDVCSKRVAMLGDELLSVETRTALSGPLQFKFNIFPGPNSSPFEVTLSDIKIYQASR